MASMEALGVGGSVGRDLAPQPELTQGPTVPAHLFGAVPQRRDEPVLSTPKHGSVGLNGHETYIHKCMCGREKKVVVRNNMYVHLYTSMPQETGKSDRIPVCVPNPFPAYVPDRLHELNMLGRILSRGIVSLLSRANTKSCRSDRSHQPNGFPTLL